MIVKTTYSEVYLGIPVGCGYVAILICSPPGVPLPGAGPPPQHPPLPRAAARRPPQDHHAPQVLHRLPGSRQL